MIWDFQAEDFDPILVRGPHVHLANYSVSLLSAVPVESIGSCGVGRSSTRCTMARSKGSLLLVHPDLQWLPRYLDSGTLCAKIAGDLAAAFTRRAGGDWVWDGHGRGLRCGEISDQQDRDYDHPQAASSSVSPTTLETSTTSATATSIKCVVTVTHLATRPATQDKARITAPHSVSTPISRPFLDVSPSASH